MENAKRKIALFAFLAVSATGFAAPRMPPEFRLVRDDSTGKTWRETGELEMPFSMGLLALKSAMRIQGYSLKHDITDGKVSAQMVASPHLLLWVKDDEEIIMSVWEKSLSATGCSWGVSLKEGQPGNNKTAAESAVQPKENNENEHQQRMDASRHDGD